MASHHVRETLLNASERQLTALFFAASLFILGVALVAAGEQDMFAWLLGEPLILSILLLSVLVGAYAGAKTFQEELANAGQSD